MYGPWQVGGLEALIFVSIKVFLCIANGKLELPSGSEEIALNVLANCAGLFDDKEKSIS